jgi:localization factor PodJL
MSASGSGVPWSINAVDPEAWADARDAARRSGLSVGEWLETAIRDAANDRGAPRRREREFMRQPESAPARPSRSEAALLASIDTLTERIDAVVREIRMGERSGPAEVRAAIQRLDGRIEHVLSRSEAVRAGGSAELERKLAEIAAGIERMSRRLEQEENAPEASEPRPASIDDLDAAIADIMMRQSALDGAAPRTSRRREKTDAGPDLSRLERQLNAMADEMQTIRRASAQGDSVELVRREIAELAARLSELAPRHMLESIETAVDAIAARLDRAAIGGRRDESVSDITEALNDIREALADVRPAESFTSVEKYLQTLANKLDALKAPGADTAALSRLQAQTEEIRSLLSSALPSDVLKALVDQIEILVHKFERGRSGSDDAIIDVIAALDRRISELSDRIEAAGREAHTGPAFEVIRNRLDELQDAVARRERPAANFEGTLRAIAEKVDATESRLSNLASIERGLAELAANLEDARTRASNKSEHAAQASAYESLPADAEVLETRFSSTGPRLHLPEFESGAAVSVPPIERMPRVEHQEQLAEDFPLEPGSGAPRIRLQSAALRVAQSEAALGDIGAPMAQPPGRTSDFIAAARRAAQAANAEQVTRSETHAPSSGNRVVLLFSGGRRALLIALTAFLVIFAALRFFDVSLLNPFGGEQPARSAPPIKPPAAAAPTAREPAKPAEEKHSSRASGTDALASAPPAGVLDDRALAPFFDQIATAPETTGSTASRNPVAVQTAAAPPADTVATEAEAGLPTALGPAALRTAAIAGDPAATYEIGARYLDGRGVRADAAEARIWFTRAADKGSAPAAYRLGSLHEKGQGGEKSAVEALRLYSLAAKAGNVKAMHNLAVMHAEGTTGKPDYAAAARTFRMAAERGVRDSQYNLGVLYARGLGVEQNLAESFRWFAIAAGQGDTDAAKKRDDVAKRLDAQTLSAARLAVQGWKATVIDTDANEVTLKPEWEPPVPPAQKRSVKK